MSTKSCQEKDRYVMSIRLHWDETIEIYSKGRSDMQRPLLAIQPTLRNAHENIVCFVGKCTKTHENIADTSYFRPEWEDGNMEERNYFSILPFARKSPPAAAGLVENHPF